MKPTHKKQIYSLNKASGSTESDKIVAETELVDAATKNVNQNTNIMANMMTQLTSTKSITIICIVGIIAYMFFQSQKQK